MSEGPRGARYAAEVQRLRTLVPSENGVTVFDAETQETSYGILFEAGLPFIFDTHRKSSAYVATVEALTEVVRPARADPEEVAQFCESTARRGILAVPYTGCFFKGNLHVYSYSGPVRGLDLSAVGDSVAEAEGVLRDRFGAVWPEAPGGIRRAQRDLLAGRRKARYDADLDVLRVKAKSVSP